MRAVLANDYDALQANCTFFAPPDEYLRHIPEGVFVNMDRGTARSLIMSLTLDRRIPYVLLADSPIATYNTRLIPNKLFITNVNGDMYINNTIKVTPGDVHEQWHSNTVGRFDMAGDGYRFTNVNVFLFVSKTTMTKKRSMTSVRLSE